MTNSERLQSWITLLANIGVIVGLAFVAIELSQNTRQLALTLEWQVNQRIVDNNRDLMVESTREAYEKAITRPEELSFAEFQAVAGLTFNLLNVLEDRYFMYEHGLISDQEWKSYIEDDIAYTLGNRFARGFWKNSKGVFAPELVEYVDDKLESLSDSASYQWYLDTLDSISVNRDRE